MMVRPGSVGFGGQKSEEVGSKKVEAKSVRELI